MIQSPKHQRTFWTILFIAFLDNLSVGILLPLVPLLLTSHSSSISILPASYTDAQGYILFGFLQAIYTIAQFIATPILGQLSDHYGRKAILVVCLFGTSLAYLLFGLGVSIKLLPLLFIARAFDGVTGGNVSVAQAVIADITDPKQRAKTYGVFGGALGIGFALGPVIGAFFSNSQIVPWFNATTPFWVTAILAATSAIITAIFLKETITRNHETRPRPSLIPLQSLVKAWQFPNLRALFSGIFVWRLGFGFWTTFATVFLIYRFGLNQQQMGYYFLYVGAWLIVSQLFLVRFFTQRFKEDQILYASVLFSAVFFCIFLIPRNWLYLFAIIPFLGSANALSITSMPAAVSRAATPATQGEYSGLSNSVQSLALSVAPILSGYLSASLTPITVIIVASVLMVIAGLIFVRYSRIAVHPE